MDVRQSYLQHIIIHGEKRDLDFMCVVFECMYVCIEALWSFKAIMIQPEWIPFTWNTYSMAGPWYFHIHFSCSRASLVCSPMRHIFRCYPRMHQMVTAIIIQEHKKN